MNGENNEECWKVIDFLPDLPKNRYYVSNFGRVYRSSYVGPKGKIEDHLYEGRFITSVLDQDGYNVVCLNYGGYTKNHRVCRLVSLAFISNPNSLPQVNHKDGIKNNDFVGNLEWCDSSYNQLHAIHVLGKQPSKNRRISAICVEKMLWFPSLDSISDYLEKPQGSFDYFKEVTEYGFIYENLHFVTGCTLKDDDIQSVNIDFLNRKHIDRKVVAVIAKTKLELLGYSVVYIGEYGACNYNLADEKSDYDFKAIIVPTLEQMIRRDAISTTIECDFGNIDIKDMLTFTTNMNKGNFSYIESLHTDYCLDFGEEFFGISIKELFKDVKINWMSMVGAIYEKRKALTHKYPSKAEEFEQFGCDPKQFMQAIRLYDILRRRSKDPDNYTKSYETYTDDGIQFELVEYESEASSRKYEFTRDELIELKRKLVMPLDETIRIFDYIQVKAREFLPRDYKFTPLDYTDRVIDLLVKYYYKEISL